MSVAKEIYNFSKSQNRVISWICWRIFRTSSMLKFLCASMRRGIKRYCFLSRPQTPSYPGYVLYWSLTTLKRTSMSIRKEKTSTTSSSCSQAKPVSYYHLMGIYLILISLRVISLVLLTSLVVCIWLVKTLMTGSTTEPFSKGNLRFKQNLM